MTKIKTKTKDEDKTPGTVHAVELNQLLKILRQIPKRKTNPLSWIASNHLSGFLVVSKPWQAFTALMHLSDTWVKYIDDERMNTTLHKEESKKKRKQGPTEISLFKHLVSLPLHGLDLLQQLLRLLPGLAQVVRPGDVQ